MGSSAVGRIQHSHDISWQTENTRTGSTPTTRRVQTLMSRIDQSHQRVLQIRNNRSTTAAYTVACRMLQKRTRALKWERRALELQRAADRNAIKGFYNGLKEVCGPKKKEPVLKSTDGMETFSESKRVVTRWSEHFQKLPNVATDINRSRRYWQQPAPNYQNSTN